MRQLLLFCLLATAATAYNLVLQKFDLTGGNVHNGKISCDTIDMENVLVGGHTFKFVCSETKTKDDPPAIDTVTLMYTDSAFATNAAKLAVKIPLKDKSTLDFDIAPGMQVGVLQTFNSTTPKFTQAVPTETTAAPTTTTTTPEVPTANDTNKVVKKTVARPVKPAANAAAADPDEAADATIPLALRLRGPGPVRLPLPLPTAEERQKHIRRRKREEAAVIDSNAADAPPVDNPVKVSLYVLDEGGNAAAVWAAVIEGIILIVLVGLCIWVFFIAPRRRGASGAVDPYKANDPNYSVSYNNTGYNQRIDAFGNPAPPPRPANNAYMDDYITDNVGAMSRPAAAPTTTQPTAVNPAISSFQPTHQRFDSSGLVTVNLS
ncbi:hypothetical protein PFISCL1PPCAC_11965 [Pristionchus fissidentatus]|uniref:Uncharacterized protein n=1 Tax=Pristionchus fissidentatus TaxID=1538716 RepID=A0AAV5VQQ9_9BILA|nr:hypothetical protein PFISCL1PPCAC_11965 [Pristionchus fissidentatus]